MAQLGNTIINGAARILGKLFVQDAQINTINGVSVGSAPKFTDTNTTAASGLTCTSAVYGSGSATTSVQTALTNLAAIVNAFTIDSYWILPSSWLE